ncbi:DNA gyrase inhibitor YacG [uncultured Roseobacter sp.]|uniref:DNA gyrase inhibitor YacG n=1 Tax=uncultured Roseobacter sp. TaxID=114847 RepID=UPI0026201C87|nr:DNA gyrase inhibitor YacG [uncultured Roseobacter sp.]
MTCPMCGRPTEEKVRPFCSKRCADLDLARWFNGSYAVPSDDLNDTDELLDALDEASRSGEKPGLPH